MVSQLLKDIVEAAESPTLTTTSASYDRFGFRIDLDGEHSLEDKAERLRRQAEDDSQNMTTEVSESGVDWISNALSRAALSRLIKGEYTGYVSLVRDFRTDPTEGKERERE